MIQAANAFILKRLRLSAAWLVVAAAMGAPSAHAQTREQGLSGAVVEADVLSAQSALPLQRLDSLAFRRRGVSSLSDALRRMGGTNVRDYGGAGGLKTVSVRGLGATHTQVVLDGLCVGDAQSGRVDLSRFPLVRLRSVALSVGGAPSLLCPVREQGAAVVRLTSYLPREQSRPVSGRASIGVGSFGAVEPAALVAGRVGERLYYNMSAHFSHADNAYPFRLENGKKTHTEKRRNSDLDEGSGEANALILLSDSAKIRAKVHYALSRRNLPGPVYFYVADNHERLRSERLFAQARFDGGGTWRTFAAAKFDFAATHYRDVDGGYSGGELRQNYWQREAYFTAGASRTVGRFEAAAAADYVFQSLSSNVAGSDGVRRHTLLGSLSAAADFDAVQNHGAPRRNGRLQFGCRRCRPSVARAVGSLARVGAAAAASHASRLRHHHFSRADVQRKLLFPLWFCHAQARTCAAVGRRRGNGVALRRKGPAAHAAPHGRRLRQPRVRQNLGPARLDVRLANGELGQRARRRTRCFACDGAWELREKHSFLLAGALSLQRVADYSDAARLSYHHQLAYTPKAAGNASLAWENPWLNASVSVVAAGARWTNNEHVAGTRLPAYAEVGVCVYRAFRVGRCGLDVRADVLNLFNAHYEIVGNYPMPGRACRLTANFSF